MYCNVVDFMEENNIVYCKQFRFRKRHSTIDAVQTLVSEILSSFQENLSVVSIFIDLRKAFNTVSHNLILSKLECLGIRDMPLNWFRSYLANRKQYTCVNGVDSDMKILDCGVPQGSLLRVLLFQLQINDMNTCIKFCNSILYADDTTIFVVGRNLRFIKSKLQSDVNSLSEWLCLNRLKLNVKKTKLLHFHKEGLQPKIVITIDGEEIESVTNFKFLGINVDKELRFEKHVNLCYLKK